MTELGRRCAPIASVKTGIQHLCAAKRPKQKIFHTIEYPGKQKTLAGVLLFGWVELPNASIRCPLLSFCLLTQPSCFRSHDDCMSKQFVNDRDSQQPAIPGTEGYIEWHKLPQPPLGFPRGKPRGANQKLNPHNAAGCSISSYQQCVHIILTHAIVVQRHEKDLLFAGRYCIIQARKKQNPYEKEFNTWKF